ncbi:MULTISPECIES: flavin reductase family protein [unclassified Streptomyces]|uniref:flavin reductase family protein n=1 Tax=unclassified Streptomyces TaxID=2593676 RepID=UPI00068BD903|nr:MULTISPECIES: flavin reductase family protein [unclassified Streptomyces]
MSTGTAGLAPITGTAIVSTSVSASASADTLRRDFSRTAARFPTGVTVLTTVADGQLHGMTVNAFATASLDPLLILTALGNTSRTARYILDTGRFAVSVLGADQQDTARWFADRSRPVGSESFAGLGWQPAPYTQCPVLDGAVAYFDCTVHDTHPAGDHTVVIGAVHAFDALTGQPSLLFSGSRFSATPTA